jgi:hypothetical protein
MPEHEARWPKEALRFSFEVAVVSAGSQRHGLCGKSSITEQIQHTLNIAKVTAQAKGQPACGSATPQSRITRRRVVSLRWTHRMMTMTKVEGGSVREAVLTNLGSLR